MTFDEALASARDQAGELLTLDEALKALAALGVSTKTVMRDWDFAKAWLQREVRNRSGRWPRAPVLISWQQGNTLGEWRRSPSNWSGARSSG